jgi:hypothetical protein
MFFRYAIVLWHKWNTIDSTDIYVAPDDDDDETSRWDLDVVLPLACPNSKLGNCSERAVWC